MSKNISILAVNAGSSSIKLELFSVDHESGIVSGILKTSITGIGTKEAELKISSEKHGLESSKLEHSDQSTAIATLLSAIKERLPKHEIDAIGHRIVHGGPNFSQPVFINDQVINEIKSLAEYDPIHTSEALQLIGIISDMLPEVPQVACFDTAFFHELPMVSQLLPLPRKYYQEGLRKYGFHGLSYTYLRNRFGEIAGDQALNGRVIYAHLGGGASLAATKDAKPIDTTMGFSPASGVVMSSRTGDLDPSIVSYLNQKSGQNLEDFNHMINYESGLLGVSELSADMYTLLQNESANPQAAEAVEIFVISIKKAIGSLAAALGGLDSLIFSGGIGEQSAILRARICADMQYMGIELDADHNAQHAELISSSSSKVGVHVLPTNEGLTIARQVHSVIQNKG